LLILFFLFLFLEERAIKYDVVKNWQNALLNIDLLVETLKTGL